MLTNDFDVDICAEHNKDDCAHCPLLISLEKAMCKYNSHYDRKRKEWMKDVMSCFREIWRRYERRK